jgi:hypothetical protein
VNFNAKVNGQWSARVAFARRVSLGEPWPKRWVLYLVAFAIGPLK